VIGLYTADRGASLGEHSIVSDSRGLYDCTLRIPFIARWPGHIVPGTRLKGMYQSEDIAPTLFEAVEPPGRDRVISLDCTSGRAWSVRTSQYKLIISEGPRRELYDLTTDPGEDRNIASQQPDVASDLENELQSWDARRIDELYRYESPFREGIVPQTATP